MIHTESNIPYAPHGMRGMLDLYSPEHAQNAAIVLVLHGGGLRALHKERMEGVSTFIAERGWIAVTPNYRLLTEHAYPAPMVDTLAAFEWIRNTHHPLIAKQNRERIAILGASAGGFLALMAGLILGKQQVRTMVSISGPSRYMKYAEGVSREGFDPRLFSTPVERTHQNAPPLLAVHSRIDEVVSHEESVAIVNALNQTGCDATLYSYDGPDKQHGIWRNADPRPRLLEHVENAIADYLQKTL